MRLVKLAVAALLLLVPVNVLSCGPFFDEVYFSYSVHPDLPLEDFAGGKLGIVQPTYGRSYLYVAYQYLAGKSFDAARQKQLGDFWRSRMRFWPATEGQKSASESYLAAREQYATLAPAPKSIDPDRETTDYMSYQNCNADAFRTAQATLQARAQQWGAQSAELRAWLEGQDAVFANCHGGEGTPAIPKAVEASAPQLLRADREYQVAAARFYATQFDDAAAGFALIARDPASPWSKVAPYLRVRALIRKATVGPEDKQQESLAVAEQELDKLLADKAYPLHADLERLRGFVAFRLHPEQRLAELAEAVSDPKDPNLAQDLWDYIELVDQAGGRVDGLDEGVAEARAKKFEESAASRKANELTDWILTYQTASAQAAQHALARWKTTKSPAWLLAAISKTAADSPDAPALIEAAQQLPANSPAFTTANYHAVRLLAARKELDAARARLAASVQPGLPMGAKNLFEAQLAMSAPDVAMFLQHAAQRPVAILSDDSGAELSIAWDEKTGKSRFAPPPKDAELLYEAAAAFNTRLPLAVWLRAAQGTEMPANVRGELALAGWTRAVILHDYESARALAAVAVQLRPETKAPLQAFLDAAEAEREHAALVAMLDMPGARPFVTLPRRQTKLQKIDNYRDNWWCPDVGANLKMNNYYKQAWDEKTPAKEKEEDPKVAAPAFLSAEQVAAGAAEWKRLAGVGSGPLYLARQVLAWQKASPQEPRVPPALYGAVRANRYSCGDKAADQAIDQVMAVLRKQYPQSPWTPKAARMH